MRMSAEYAFGIVRPPDESMPPDSPIYRSLGNLRFYSARTCSSYLGFDTSTMSELDFLCELVRRTGCRLLCDVSNVYLSARNLGYGPYGYIDGLPAGDIGELHLGGFTPEEDEADQGAEILIDTHAARIAEPVWELYAHAVRRFGAKPTLIEWDNDIPPFAALLAEARRADEVATRALEPRHAVAG
jgi:uncharacterized protein